MPRPSAPNPEICNFGGNIRFRPGHYYEPRTEEEVLDILRRHARGRVRVGGALHSWSDLVVSGDAVVSMRHWRQIDFLEDAGGGVVAAVGSGWQIKHLLRALRPRQLTLPAIGLITEQTVVGAIATGTHGSGNHSLGHYIQSVRFAAYDEATGEPRVYEVDDGPELRALRCHLGCLGIILSVTFRCRPEYCVGERNARYATMEEVLAEEPDSPLQHFFLVPHAWSYIAQHRAPAAPMRSVPYRIDMRAYLIGWFLTMDVGLHLAMKFLCSRWGGRSLTRSFFRRVMPYALIEEKTFVGRSDEILTWRHELFRHFEMELFVPGEHVTAAARMIAEVLKVCDGIEEPAAEEASALQSIGLLNELRGLRGTYTHHYPICVRRVLRDDTLISMSSGDDEAWYSFSLITLRRPTDDFRGMADFLANVVSRLFRGRLHWGKYFPLDAAYARSAYPCLPEFFEICRRYDPHGVFQNDFTRRVLEEVMDAESERVRAAVPVNREGAASVR